MTKDMTKDLARKLIQTKDKADKLISELSPGQKAKLEKTWDIEHAYYSSALEGSKIDRQEFDELAKNVK